MQDKSKFLLVLDVFGGLTALLLVLTWLYGLQARSWYRARELGRTHPAVALLPEPLPGMAARHDLAMTLNEFGYEFEAPKTQIETHRTGQAVAAYAFSSGLALSFYNPAEITTTIQAVREAMEQSNRPFVDFLGARSEYELLKLELSATPGQITPFMPKQEAYRQGMLLSLKRMEVRNSPSAMYSIALNGRRGFELGDPSKDRVVEVRLFDGDDREFRFLFAVQARSNAKLDQAQINGVIETLRAAGSGPR